MLRDVFCSPTIVKVFHSGQQDLEILYQLFGRPVAPIFDTQCAAALLGTVEQLSYSGLVKMILDVDLKKSGRFSQWAHRPLSENQLSYAADDVTYLLQTYPIIRERLTKLGRLAWLDEEFAQRASVDYVSDIAPEQAYRYVKRISSLSPRQAAVARAVAAWRQTEAIRRDRPRRHILPDETIVEIARRQPRSAEALESIRGLTPAARRQAQQILHAVRDGLRVPDDELPRTKINAKQNGEVDASVRLAAALVARRAKEHRIAPQVLANNELLEEFVRTPDAHAQLMQGWRRLLIGNELLDLLEGRTALYLKNGKVETCALPVQAAREYTIQEAPETPHDEEARHASRMDDNEKE